VREQIVLEAVVQRDLRRRAHDDDRALAVEPKLGEHRLLRLEVGEVVLLLQALIRAQLACRAVAVEPLWRDRVGHDDGACEPAVDVVLDRRPLVVEHRRARNAKQRSSDRHVVRAVPERDVEATPTRRALLSASPARERDRHRLVPGQVQAANSELAANGVLKGDDPRFLAAVGKPARRLDPGSEQDSRRRDQGVRLQRRQWPRRRPVGGRRLLLARPGQQQHGQRRHGRDDHGRDGEHAPPRRMRTQAHLLPGFNRISV